MLDVSERFACRVLCQHCSTYYKRIEATDDEATLTATIINLARQFGRYGYWRLTALLRAEGWYTNHKRGARLWLNDGVVYGCSRINRTRCGPIISWRAGPRMVTIPNAERH